MTEHKTDMSITNTKPENDGAPNRHEHYWKTEQYFYRGIQNWHDHDWKTEQHFYDGILVYQTLNLRECLQVVLTRLSDIMIAIKVLLTSSTLGFDKVV